MSKLEVKEIGPISGETDLKLGQSGGTVTLADGATAVGFGGESPVKAWVKFIGAGTVTISGSANVSSVTDIGLGSYFVNFTNALPDVNFSAVVTGQNTTIAGFWPNVSVDRDQTITTSGFGIICYIYTGTPGDNAQISAMVAR